MSRNDKINTAVTIFKKSFPDARGKFRAAVSDSNGSEVIFFACDGIYCTINIRSGRVKNI